MKASKFTDAPQDVSVITIHDVKFAPDLRVPLAVVAMPLFQMGEVAVKSIFNSKSNTRKRTELNIVPRLLLRESTSEPRSKS